MTDKQITEGATVRGYLHREDGNHVYFAGEVIECYVITLYGFEIAMVKVGREGDTRVYYTYASDVELVDVRPDADVAVKICADGYVITRGMVDAEIERTAAIQLAPALGAMTTTDPFYTGFYGVSHFA